MSLTMSPAEREAFLAEAHVAIVSIAETGRGPLSVPVWYLYEPGGDVRFSTGASSRKARLLRKVGRVSLCVQLTTRPYKYVSIEGPIVSIEPAQIERDLRPLAYRYLGPEEGERYLATLSSRPENRGSVWVRIRPERWLAEDYSKEANSQSAE